MQFHYNFGGVRLSSNVKLGQLRVDHGGESLAGSALHVTISNDIPPQPDSIVHRWRGRYGLTLGIVGENWLMASSLDGVFLIDPARSTIRCFVTQPEAPTWLDVFVRRILPRVAILCGATAIHAAAVGHADGGALLMLGDSGAGKSTLAASLGTAGWDVLSDDISILWHDPLPIVAPSTTGTCVWDDTRAALDLPDEICHQMPGYEGKFRFAPPLAHNSLPVPLKAVIFLARSPEVTQPEFRRMPLLDSLARAGRQRIRFNPADASGTELRGFFERTSEIVRRTPCYRLAYPAHYAALPVVRAALETVLRQ